MEGLASAEEEKRESPQAEPRKKPERPPRPVSMAAKPKTPPPPSSLATPSTEGEVMSSESSLPPGEKAEVRTEGKTTALEVRRLSVGRE